MPKKKQSMILEDKLFRPILAAKDMTYKDFFELYAKSSVEQSTDDKSGCTYSGFLGWLTVYGIKFKRIPSFLDLLGYRLIAVPKNAFITVSPSKKSTKKAEISPSTDSSKAGIHVVTADPKSQCFSVDFLENQYHFSLRRRKTDRRDPNNGY